MEDRRCKLGLQGRHELVSLIERGSTLTDAERASLECLRTRSSRPRSCPWALSAEAEQAILTAREHGVQLLAIDRMHEAPELQLRYALGHELDGLRRLQFSQRKS